MKRIIAAFIALIAVGAYALEGRYESVPISFDIAPSTTGVYTNLTPSTGRIVAYSMWCSGAATATVDVIEGMSQTARSLAAATALTASNGIVANVSSNYYVGGDRFKVTVPNASTNLTKRFKGAVLVEK